MKKFLLTVLMISSKLLLSQISIIPQATHYNDPYPAIIYGSGTIYYTTDGSMPTINSSSAINNVQINIDQNKEIKAFVVSTSGTVSSVFSKKYYVGTNIPIAQIYFKAPTTWTNGSCVRVDMVNPNSINGFVIDNLGSGFSMTNTGCENWYKLERYFENANVSFTNCWLYPNFPSNISTNLIPMDGLILYDFTNGVITNPPACLLLNTTEIDKTNMTLVKVYPNPVSEILKVNTNVNFQEYEITDMTGKIIFRDKFSKEISVSHLTSGNYFIKLKNSEGNLTLLKFIKK